MQDVTGFSEAYIDGRISQFVADLQRDIEILGIVVESTHNVVHTQESLWVLDLRLEASIANVD